MTTSHAAHPSGHGHPAHRKHHAPHAARHNPALYERQVIATIIDVGHERKLDDDSIVTALMVGLQESGLRNLKGGDRDSAGWRQERAMWYGSLANRTNVRASVGRFYNELKTHNRRATLGAWAQSVQRSAYPSLYQPHEAEARRILAAYNAEKAGTPTGVK